MSWRVLLAVMILPTVAFAMDNPTRNLIRQLKRGEISADDAGRLGADLVRAENLSDLFHLANYEPLRSKALEVFDEMLTAKNTNALDAAVILLRTDNPKTLVETMKVLNKHKRTLETSVFQLAVNNRLDALNSLDTPRDFEAAAPLLLLAFGGKVFGEVGFSFRYRHEGEIHVGELAVRALEPFLSNEEAFVLLFKLYFEGTHTRIGIDDSRGPAYTFFNDGDRITVSYFRGDGSEFPLSDLTPLDRESIRIIYRTIELSMILECKKRLTP